MTDTIYISHTYSNNYSNQGMSPSGQEGYDVFYAEPDDTMQYFLGWIPPDKFDDLVAGYIYTNDSRIAVRFKNMDSFLIIYEPDLSTDCE